MALKPFLDLKFKKILGIEPAKNLAKLANKDKIKTFNGFLTEKNIKKIKKNADLILASNVFAHSDNLNEMANCMIKLLSKKGTIIIEVQYLMNTLKDLTFDNIYHEHYNYWSLTSLVNFFKKYKVKIFKAEKIDTHGGSLRIYISKNTKIKIDKSILNILKEEERFGLKKAATYTNFGKKIEKLKEKVTTNIKMLKSKYKSIVGYGAPAKATTALNYFNIKDELDYIIEDNPLKKGKFIPGVNIKIQSKQKNQPKIDCVLVLAWNFFNDIRNKNKSLSDNFINIKSLEKD